MKDDHHERYYSYVPWLSFGTINLRLKVLLQKSLCCLCFQTSFVWRSNRIYLCLSILEGRDAQIPGARFIIILLIIIITTTTTTTTTTTIELSLGGSSPYTSTDKQIRIHIHKGSRTKKHSTNSTKYNKYKYTFIYIYMGPCIVNRI